VSESTLNLPMSDLKGEIGDYLGYGRGVDGGEEEWADDIDRQITRLLNTALRWVYDSATLDPRQAPHQWSWLTPSTSVVIAGGQKLVPLPDDFGGFTQKFLIVTQEDEGSVRAKIPLVGEPYIDQMYAYSPETSGRPVYAAEKVGRGNKAVSTRSELYLYPIPDTAYTFRGQYHLIARALTADAPFPYGDAKMASCYQAACRAAAEMYEDQLRPGEGTEWPIFQRELAAAIQRDGRHAPKTLGKNIDRSDPSRHGLGRGWWSDGTIGFQDPMTVDGVQYD
jgi:hypothetical protein